MIARDVRINEGKLYLSARYIRVLRGSVVRKVAPETAIACDRISGKLNVDMILSTKKSRYLAETVHVCIKQFLFTWPFCCVNLCSVGLAFVLSFTFSFLKTVTTASMIELDIHPSSGCQVFHPGSIEKVVACGT